MNEFDDTSESGSRRLLVVLSLVVALGLAVALFVFQALRSQPAPSPAAGPPASGTKVEPQPRPAAEPAREEPVAAKAAPRPRRPPAEPAKPAEPPPPTTGTLRVDADVPGASVFLDRTFVGTVPATIDNVAPGPHRLNVSAQGYDGWSDDVEVKPGPADVSVRFKVVRLSQSIPVVHKHTIGSCEGTLLATPEGIRYDTSKKDDAFSVALSNLEVFEVDYLRKNLRIKVKGGKTYNFTDRNETADALFVFHREVQKARDQIAKGFSTDVK
jgi:hypothetical protein